MKKDIHAFFKLVNGRLDVDYMFERATNVELSWLYAEMELVQQVLLERIGGSKKVFQIDYEEDEEDS